MASSPLEGTRASPDSLSMIGSTCNAPCRPNRGSTAGHRRENEVHPDFNGASYRCRACANHACHAPNAGRDPVVNLSSLKTSRRGPCRCGTLRQGPLRESSLKVSRRGPCMCGTLRQGPLRETLMGPSKVRSNSSFQEFPGRRIKDCFGPKRPRNDVVMSSLKVSRRGPCRCGTLRQGPLRETFMEPSQARSDPSFQGVPGKGNQRLLRPKAASQ